MSIIRQLTTKRLPFPVTIRAAVHVAPRVTHIATRKFTVSAPKFDRIADAEEQIKLGTEHMNNGSIDMAMNNYHKSVQIAPSGAGYFNIGVCYFQMGKHKDAIKSFERSLEFTPHSADAHTNIASAYIMLKDIPNAIKHLEQASNFNPLDGEVQYNLACVYEATGKLKDAKTRFERAADLGIAKAEASLAKLAKKM
ncbi:hypothetical protein J3Q64DRAFT_1832669 [Phycomyces blakesleeanus]|uniref:TPR-like protein n=1 Tax=Phycomyces blakesleeanus TaxID=4837 RepID=A0ABR3B4T1_PHYBL